jgi:hypothetical protein
MVRRKSGVNHPLNHDEHWRHQVLAIYTPWATYMPMSWGLTTPGATIRLHASKFILKQIKNT